VWAGRRVTREGEWEFAGKKVGIPTEVRGKKKVQTKQGVSSTGEKYLLDVSICYTNGVMKGKEAQKKKKGPMRVPKTKVQELGRWKKGGNHRSSKGRQTVK